MDFDQVGVGSRIGRKRKTKLVAVKHLQVSNLCSITFVSVASKLSDDSNSSEVQFARNYPSMLNDMGMSRQYLLSGVGHMPIDRPNGVHCGITVIDPYRKVQFPMKQPLETRNQQAHSLLTCASMVA